MPDATCLDIRITIRLLASFVLLYLSTANGVLEYGDDWSMLHVTRAIVDHMGVDIPSDAPGSVAGKDGRYYSKYGIGQSIVGIPFYAAGTWWAGLRGHPVFAGGQFLQATELTYMATMVGVVASATSVALLFLTCRALAFTVRGSVLTALALGIGTFAWHYSRTFMTEPTSALALLLAFYGQLRWWLRRTSSWLILSGAAGGASILLRIGMVVALPALGAWLLWTLWEARLETRRAVIFVAAWACPIAAAFLTLTIYNAIRFGTISETGYGNPADHLGNPVWVGLWGFVASSGKSVFVYAPILVASAAGWAALWKRSRRVAAIIPLLAGCYLTFHAGLNYWWGGGAWGPRYATVLLPFLLLGLPALIDRGMSRSGWIALTLVGLLSVFIQIESVIVPYIPYETRMEATPALFDELLWNPAYSPIVYQAKSLIHAAYPPALTFTYFQASSWMWFQAIEFVAAFVLLSGCVWRTCRTAMVSSSR